MLSSWYLIFNIAILLTSALLAIRFNVKPLHIKRLAKCYLLVSLPFVLWDMWALSRGHWSFNTMYTLDKYLFNIAVEEVLFFITVPLICLIVFLIILRSNKHSTTSMKAHLPIIMIGLFAGYLMIISPALSYTQVVGVVGLTFCGMLLVMRPKVLYLQAFWSYQIILLVMFILANTFLTSLPIIIYSQEAIVGFRIGTIPLEDFLYNFVLNSSFVLLYVSNRQKLPL